MRPFVLLAAGTVLIAGCGGNSDAPSATGATVASTTSTMVVSSDTTAPTVEVVATTLPAVAPTTPPTTTPTTAPTTAATTTLPDALSDSCVQGSWLMSVPATSALFASLLPGFPLTVEGSGTLEIAGDTIEHFLNVVATIAVDDTVVTGPYDIHYTGTYLIENGAMLVTVTSQEGGWGTLVAQTPAGQFDVPAPPTGDVPPFAGGPATCDGDLLRLTYTSGIADGVAVFDRR